MFGFLKKIFGGETVDVKALLTQGAIILDVRTPQEFKAGHPGGAINIPLQNIDSQLKKIKKFKKPIITCCASGRRSGIAANRLKEAGVEAHNGGSWVVVSSIVKSKKH